MPMFADNLRGLSSALIVAAIAVGALVFGRDMLVPFALAVILAFIFAPIVRRLVVLGVPRGAAAGAVVALAVAVLVVASVAFSAQMLTLAGELAAHKDNLIRKVRLVTGAAASEGALSRASASIDSLARDLKREIKGPTTGETGGPVIVARGEDGGEKMGLPPLHDVLAPLTFAGLTLLFTLFLLIQYQDLRDRVVRLAGTDNMSLTAAALSEAGSRLSDLFTTQAVLNAGYGLFVAVALALLGVPSAILWGVATALLRFVPFIGAFLAAVPPLLLAAAVDPGWTKSIAVLAIFVIGEPIMGHVVEPMMLGRRAGLSPLAFVASVSFWTTIWGPIGLILAAPLTMTIVVLGQYIPRFEFMSILLGDDPALAPEQEFYNRLLASDAVSAYEQFETGQEETGLAAAGDGIVLPALRIAARDHRTGRVSDEQVETLRATMGDFLGMVQDEIASTGGAPEQTDDEAVLVLPARGPIDAMAARFVSTALAASVPRRIVALEQGTGLMALASAGDALNGDMPSDIVVVTVGGLERSFGRLIQRRAARDFPGSRVVSCALDAKQHVAAAPAEGEAAATCTSLRELRDVISAERAKRSEPAVVGDCAPLVPAAVAGAHTV